MTPTRALVLVLSLACAFLLGREFARRQAPDERPGSGYQLQVAEAVSAGQALDRVPASRTTSFVDVADRLRPSVVSIIGENRRERLRGGTGVVVSSEGAILTNYHVISGLSVIGVTLSSMDRYPATVIGQDEATDLALIKIDATGLFPATFGDSDAVKVGEDDLVIGNASGFGWTVTRGIISNLHRSDIEIQDRQPARGGPTPYTDYIQTDAAINHGNSGGPVVNARGEVIGIAVARNDSSEAIGFAIPSNDARFVANELLESGKVRRGYLGVEADDLYKLSNEARRRFAPGALGGLVIKAVHLNTPAERSGLVVNDIIVALDGRPVESMSVLRSRVARVAPSTGVTLTVFRDGRQQEMRAVVGDYPQDSPPSRPAIPVR